MRRTILWTSSLLLAWAGGAFGDGDSRPATADEKGYCLKVLTAFEKALPPGPEGWEMADRTEVAPPERVTVDQENFSMSVSYHVRWQDTRRMEAFNAQMNTRLPDISRSLAPDAGMKDLEARLAVLIQAYAKALEAGDMARATTLQQEMETLSNAFNARADEKEQAFDEQIAAITPHDVDLKVSLFTNLYEQGFVNPPSSPAVLSGCQIIRINDQAQTSTGWHEGTTYAFMGNFALVNRDGNVAMAALEKAGLPHTAVQTVVIRIQAEEGRARSFLDQTDWRPLKALLGQ